MAPRGNSEKCSPRGNSEEHLVSPRGNTEGLAGEKQTISSRFLSGVEMGGIIKHLKNGPTGKQWVWFPLDLNVPLGFPPGNTEGLAGEKQTISSRFLSGVEMGGIIKHLKNGPTGKQWVWFPLDLNVPLGFPPGNTEGFFKANDFFTVFIWCWDGRYNKTLKEWPHGETVSLVSPRPKCSSRLPLGEHRGSRRGKANDFFTVFIWCWDGRYNKTLKEWPHGETVSLVSPRPKCSSRLPLGEHRGSRRGKANDFFTVFIWCWDGRYNKTLKEWPHGETVSLVSPRPKCSSRLPLGEHWFLHGFYLVLRWEV